jgi:hypothetical protein
MYLALILLFSQCFQVPNGIRGEPWNKHPISPEEVQGGMFDGRVVTNAITCTYTNHGKVFAFKLALLSLRPGSEWDVGGAVEQASDQFRRSAGENL